MSSETRRILEACAHAYCALRFHATPRDARMLDMLDAYAQKLSGVSAMDLLSALQARDTRFQFVHACVVSPMHSRERLEKTIQKCFERITNKHALILLPRKRHCRRDGTRPEDDVQVVVHIDRGERGKRLMERHREWLRSALCSRRLSTKCMKPATRHPRLRKDCALCKSKVSPCGLHARELLVVAWVSEND